MIQDMVASSEEKISLGAIPSRVHHNAYVCRDLEQTRQFYEDILGWPLVATWREEQRAFDEDLVFCHTFYKLGDDSLLAFFSFDNPELHQRFAEYGPHSPFVHLALKVDEGGQKEIGKRLSDAKYETYKMDHGYCVSLYVTDPNGLRLEFTVDHADWQKMEAARTLTAHEDLRQWLSGNRTSNNDWRAE